MKTTHLGYMLSACFLLLACSESKHKKVEFDALPLESIKSTVLTIDTLPCNTFFSNPTSIHVLNDSLLFTFDDNRGDKMCHIININQGHIVKSFGEGGSSYTHKERLCLLTVYATYMTSNPEIMFASHSQTFCKENQG